MMNRKRTPINKETKATVIEHNGGRFCKKCKRFDSLHFHHIKAVSSGGTNNPYNLALLCSACHKEWHSVESASTLEFGVWVAYPPAHRMIAMIEAAAKFPGATGSAQDFAKLILDVNRAYGATTYSENPTP